MLTNIFEAGCEWQLCVNFLHVCFLSQER